MEALQAGGSCMHLTRRRRRRRQSRGWRAGWQQTRRHCTNWAAWQLALGAWLARGSMRWYPPGTEQAMGELCKAAHLSVAALRSGSAPHITTPCAAVGCWLHAPRHLLHHLGWGHLLLPPQHPPPPSPLHHPPLGHRMARRLLPALPPRPPLLATAAPPFSPTRRSSMRRGRRRSAPQHWAAWCSAASPFSSPAATRGRARPDFQVHSCGWVMLQVLVRCVPLLYLFVF